MARQSGFTLIELVAVIVLLGLLAVTALPRFASLQDDAARAAAKSLMTSFQGTARMTHYQWRTRGEPASITLVADVIPMGSDGWPAPSPVNTANCIALWNGLQQAPPFIEAMVFGSPADEWTSFGFGTACIFAYQRGTAFNGALTPFFAYFPVSLPVGSPSPVILGGSVQGFNLD